MKSLILCLAIFGAAFAHIEHPVSHSMVESIRAARPAWTPMEPHENPFYDYSVSEIQAMLGTIVGEEELPYDEVTLEDDLFAAPDSFDAREQWPQCVHKIRNQGACGSCWAFGASEALSDRFCVASNGTVDVVLSPQDLVSCDTSNYGCQGGILPRVWKYIKENGVVSDKCKPYSFLTKRAGLGLSCMRKSGCSSLFFGNPERYYVDKIYRPRTVSAIKRQLVENGPLEGAFTVYADFMNYKSGVYHHTSGENLGGHAIKVIGYGKQDGLNYWLCANSWGPRWGESGFFKIKMGTCGINNEMIAGEPRLS